MTRSADDAAFAARRAPERPTVSAPDAAAAPPGEAPATPTEIAHATPPASVAQPRRTRKTKARQARVVLRKLGPWSVFKVSLFFYTCVMAVIILAAMILYAILGAMGSLTAVTKLARELFSDETFRIHGDWLFVRMVVTGAVMVVVWSLINVFVVFLYNLISDVIGGIEVTLSERR
jgi:hypothetical protein